MPIAFGALADLLEATSGEVAVGLSGPQRRAMAAAFGQGEGEEPADWLVLAAAVLASVRTLSARGPLLLAIDDLHWADTPSLRWLLYLTRRLEGVPLLVVAGTRPPEGRRSSDRRA